MKKLILFLCLVISLSMLATPADAQASRVASKAAKAMKEVVKKTPKKTKARTKTTPRPHTPVNYNSTVTCGNCNGTGTVTYWNSYYQVYQSSQCTRCSGTGKVRKQ